MSVSRLTRPFRIFWFGAVYFFNNISHFEDVMNPLEMDQNSNLEVFDFRPEEVIQGSPKKAMPVIQALIGLH